MADLTNTQTRILTAGAQRPGNLAMPLPKAANHRGGGKPHAQLQVLRQRCVQAKGRKHQHLRRDGGPGIC